MFTQLTADHIICVLGPIPGQQRQAPIDFMLRGYLGVEPIGLELIDGYHMEIFKLERLGLP